MMPINVNWKEVEDGFGDSWLPPEGKYKATIVNCEIKESVNTGEYYNVELQLQDEKYMKTRIFDSIFFHTDKAQARAKAIFKNIGLGDILEKRTPTEKDICKTSVFVVDLVHEEYNNRKRAKPNFFKGYYPIDTLHEEKDPFDNENFDGGEPPF